MNVDKTADQPTALYRIYDANDRLIYVGQSQRMGQRMRGHMLNSWWYELLHRIEVEYHPTRAAGISAESLAIQEDQPAFNVMGTTDRPVLTDADVEIAWRCWRSGRRYSLGMTYMDLLNERVRGIPRRSRTASAAA